MLPRLLHAVTGAALAIAAGVVVMGVGVAAVRMLPAYRTEPMDVIPADATDLFLQHPDAAFFSRERERFPQLASVPWTPQLWSIAVLRHADGTRGVVTFTRTNGPAPAGAVQWGAYLVDAHPPATRALLRPEQSLRSALRNTELDRTLPSAVFRREAATEDPHALLLLRMLGTSPFLIRTTESDGTVTLTFPETLLHAAPAAAPDIPGILVLRMGGLPAALQHAQQSLSSAERAILEGHMLRMVHDRLGKRISLPYTLLPLLNEDGTVVIAGRGSGTQMVFGGSAGSPEDARAVFDDATASFRAEIVPVTELHETFDRRFDWKSVMKDDAQMIATDIEEHGWTLRLVEDRRTGRQLAVALRDRRVLLSTDGGLLREILQAEDARSAFHGVAARGTVTAALATAFGVREGARWEMRIEGNRAVVRIPPP